MPLCRDRRPHPIPDRSTVGCHSARRDARHAAAGGSDVPGMFRAARAGTAGGGKSVARLTDCKMARIYSLVAGSVGAAGGVIIMLINVDDPEAIGPGMAMCLLSCLYAQLLSFGLCLPVQAGCAGQTVRPGRSSAGPGQLCHRLASPHSIDHLMCLSHRIETHRRSSQPRRLSRICSGNAGESPRVAALPGWRRHAPELDQRLINRNSDLEAQPV